MQFSVTCDSDSHEDNEDKSELARITVNRQNEGTEHDLPASSFLSLYLQLTSGLGRPSTLQTMRASV